MIKLQRSETKENIRKPDKGKVQRFIVEGFASIFRSRMRFVRKGIKNIEKHRLDQWTLAELPRHVKVPFGAASF